jgi:hypothetical protein
LKNVSPLSAAFVCHARSDHLTREQGSLHVHLHHSVERLTWIVLERPDLFRRGVGRRVERGGIDENVRDLRELRCCPLDGGAIRYVDGEALHPVASGGLRDVEDRDLGPAGGEPTRDLAAHLAGTAGDDGQPAVEREEIRHDR